MATKPWKVKSKAYKIKSKTSTLYDYGIDEICTWKRTASNRIKNHDEKIKMLSNIISHDISKLNKIKKRRINDVIWVRKLKRHLFTRVIK